MTGTQIDQLIQLLAKLPGLGPRSARRAALHLIDRKESLLRPLAQAMGQAADSVAPCDVCGNLDSVQPCAICRDQRRDGCQICVVESVADLWALERSGVFRGRYHVLGGTLSALDGIGPEDLNVGALIARAGEDAVGEVILATNATVDGQTTAHFLAEKLSDCNVKVSGL
ncbi:MAG: recombination mediator RecR, partial [Alphaproteobacteria bacterium]|nr:recombination mediator RecR [Alphaproteobacteria bacterium]